MSHGEQCAQETDPVLQKGMQWVLDNDITDVVFATFAVEAAPPPEPSKRGAGDGDGDGGDGDGAGDGGGDGDGGSGDTDDRGDHGFDDDDDEANMIELVPGGRDIEVDESNKGDYVRLMAEWRSGGEAKEAVDAFIDGIHEVRAAALQCTALMAVSPHLLSSCYPKLCLRISLWRSCVR